MSFVKNNGEPEAFDNKGFGSTAKRELFTNAGSAVKLLYVYYASAILGHPAPLYTEITPIPESIRLTLINRPTV